MARIETAADSASNSTKINIQIVFFLLTLKNFLSFFQTTRKRQILKKIYKTLRGLV